MKKKKKKSFHIFLNGKVKKILSILFLIIAFDQSVKWMMIQFLDKNQVIPVTSFFDLTLVYNFGISFGMFQSPGMLGVWILSSVALLLCLWIVGLIIQSNKKIEYISFSMIISGALSNVLDRMIHGGVVDFLSFHWKRYYWPAFNFADCAIVCGAALIFVSYLWQPSNR